MEGRVQLLGFVVEPRIAFAHWQGVHPSPELAAVVHPNFFGRVLATTVIDRGSEQEFPSGVPADRVIEEFSSRHEILVLPG